MGVIYVKENQSTEEEILANNDHSVLFDEFLTILGEKVRLKGTTGGECLQSYITVVRTRGFVDSFVRSFCTRLPRISMPYNE